MPINTLEAATIFTTVLDKQMIEGSTSGWMEQNAGQVKYSGGNEIKIPKMSLSGLGDYDRDNGYSQGAVTLTYQTKTMTMDRGRKFMLDRNEVDETNFVASAAAVMSEFQLTKIIPEVDAYRYSKIYSLAKGSYGKTYTPAASTILSALTADITAVQDAAGAADLVIIMPYTVADMLDNNEKINRSINVTVMIPDMASCIPAAHWFAQGCPEDKFTLSPGDIIARGECGDITNAADLERQHTEKVIISAVRDCRFGSKSLWHWEITGV